MCCPFCSHKEAKVLESRLSESSLRRRRECLHCSNRFTTYEKAFFFLKVIKKDGREEDFNLQKIYNSLQKAYRKPEPSVLLALMKKIEQKIINKKVNPIKTTEIGRTLLQELKKLDKMAYLRYASVYKSIDDPLLLKKELQLLV